MLPLLLLLPLLPLATLTFFNCRRAA